MIDIKQSCTERTKQLLVILTIFVGILLNIIRAIIPILNLPISTIIINGYIRYAHLLLGVSLFLLIVVLFKNVGYNRLLLWSDKYSYHYYLIHGLFILSPLTLLNLTSLSLLNCVIAVIAGAALSVLFRLVSEVVSHYLEGGVTVECK